MPRIEKVPYKVGSGWRLLKSYTSRFAAIVGIGFVWLAAPLRAQFVYVVNSGGNNVSAYSIGSNGALIPVPGSPFATESGSVSVAVDPRGRFVYVANGFFSRVPSTISAFSIGPDGALRPVPGSPFPTGTGPVRGGPGLMAVDPTGRFLYVTNGFFSNNPDFPLVGNISAFGIGPDGTLTPVSGSPFAAAPTVGAPGLVAVDPTGRFAYVISEDANLVSWVSSYSIGSNGALTPLASPFPGGLEATSVVVDPKGKFVYLVVAEVSGPGENGVIFGYSIGSSGALINLPGHVLTGGGPFSAAVDPTGRFVYVANSFGGGILAYTIASDGALSPFLGSLVANEAGSVAVDPTGKFVYVAGGNLSGYAIGFNGALTPLPGSPFAAQGGGPIAITPLVPFATSFAKLEIKEKPSSHFDLNESFTLGRNSNGINPVTENVTLQIGTFSVTIPAGSFKQNPNRRFAFDGVINGVSLEAQIVPLGNNIFTFKAEGTGVDLTGLINPVTVVLTIGIDSGGTAVTAQFQ
jgi:DNA-binding beta-propeller fold protein YncE